MFGMVGSMSAWVWARDLLKYQGLRQEQGEAGRSTLRPIESISRNVPTRLELWYSGEDKENKKKVVWRLLGDWEIINKKIFFHAEWCRIYIWWIWHENVEFFTPWQIFCCMISSYLLFANKSHAARPQILSHIYSIIPQGFCEAAQTPIYIDEK